MDPNRTSLERSVDTDIRALLCDVEGEMVEHSIELGTREWIPAEVHLNVNAPAGTWLDRDGAEFSVQCQTSGRVTSTDFRTQSSVSAARTEHAQANAATSKRSMATSIYLYGSKSHF